MTETEENREDTLLVISALNNAALNSFLSPFLCSLWLYLYNVHGHTQLQRVSELDVCVERHVALEEEFAVGVMVLCKDSSNHVLVPWFAVLVVLEACYNIVKVLYDVVIDTLYIVVYTWVLKVLLVLEICERT